MVVSGIGGRKEGGGWRGEGGMMSDPEVRGFTGPGGNRNNTNGT